MYLNVKARPVTREIFSHIFQCVGIDYESGEDYYEEINLSFVDYGEIMSIMLAAKTALINMLPDDYEIIVFDLIKNEDQDSKVAGTFKMEVNRVNE